MKYAPSLCDFQNGFFMLERSKDPYFLVSRSGQVLRSNRVGTRFLTWLRHTQPQLLESLFSTVNSALSNTSQKVYTRLIGQGRKRILRAVPVPTGDGFLVEIDRV